MRKLALHLSDSLTLSGNIIDFRVYDANNIVNMARIAHGTGKKLIGLDTFAGLDAPSATDNLNPNPHEIKRGQHYITEQAVTNMVKAFNNVSIYKTNYYKDLETLLPDDRYCFAVVDMKQYQTTKSVLDYVWNKMSYGGTIFVLNYEESANHSESAAIKEFVADNHHINVSRQMVVEGVKEKFIAIKCYNENNKPDNWDEIKNSREKVTIALVLKTGGEIYNHNYVNALAKSIKQNTTINHELVCLTDDPTGISSDVDRIISLNNNYPTWWSKIELFRDGQFTTNRVFYLDLDTLVVGNLDEILSYSGKFAGLRDFYALHSLGSGIMAWDTRYTSHIYTKFAPISRSIITGYKEGDQRWIDENKPSIDYFQDIYPNEIVSYKRHCVDSTGSIKIPQKAKIVCFHGNPRPHMIKHEAIVKHWQP
jgi:hypothetical protein